MHPATDESATYAFGRFVTITIQPPASLSLLNHFMNGYLQSGWAYFDQHINYHLDNKRECLTESRSQCALWKYRLCTLVCALSAAVNVFYFNRYA